MKTAERIAMVAILFFLVGGTTWAYFAIKQSEQEMRDSVARGDYEIPDETGIKNVGLAKEAWQVIYPNTTTITIKGKTVRASVADSLSERIKGLSDTPFLPEGVVKLFVFEAAGEHSIWMKSMNYPLDVIWTDKEGKIVHIEENLSPDSYPTPFPSPVPAWYVIEANAGFVASSSIKVGDETVLPTTRNLNLF